jgi:hypothetical protein
MGEASELEYKLWPPGKRVGFHSGIFNETPFILDTMEEFSLRATFFIEAWNVENYPGAIRAIAAAGHEVASHGYRHETWFLQSPERQIEILEHAQQLFESIGIKPAGFRPPGGISMSATEDYLSKLGYTYVSPVGGVAGIRNNSAIIPSEMHGTDMSYYRSSFRRFAHPRATGSDTEKFVSGFRHMLDEIAEAGDCRSPVSHLITPLDTKERRSTFRKICELTVHDDRLWHTTMKEAASWMLGNPSLLPSPPLRSFEPDWDPRKIGSYEDV